MRRALLLTLLWLPIAAVADDQGVSFLGFQSRVPADWVSEQPSSGMRALQYRIGDGGSDGVEFIVYYFGPGQGGSLEANLQRWQSQFTGPDGGPVEPRVTRIDGALPATLVELEGSYARGVGMGPAGDARPARMLLAGLVETPRGNLYPQLHGPADLVRGLKPAFADFLQALRPDEDAPRPSP
jgi:hypothetical protein